MADFIQDLRFALRLLRKNLVITAASVGSLALGIGSTSAVFSLVDALLLRPLPSLGSAGRLVSVVGIRTKDPAKFTRLSWADYLDYAGHKEVLSGLAAMADCDLSLTGNGPAERVSGLAVSSNYFSVLGLKPARGRLFAAWAEEAPVAVLGYGLWQRRFGADPAVIGSVLSLNGKKVTVVGIAPKGFWGTDLSARREVWFPLGIYSDIVTGVVAPFTGQHDRKHVWLSAVGRLASGVDRGRAQGALAGVAGSLAAAYTEARDRGVRVLPLNDLALGPVNRPLVVGFFARIMAVTALVLAVAAFNVAGLLLASALARRREIAIRLGLGASRVRLIRQLLAEGLLLALFGGGLGVVLVRLSLPLLERLQLPASLAVRELRLSGRMLGFALLVSLTSCLVFALVPGLQAIRTALVPTLRGETPRLHHWRFGLRELLASCQVALALLSLIAAGLLLRTMRNIRSIDPGFDPAHVLAVSVDLSPARYTGPQTATLYRNLLESLRRLPGVEEASMASALPLMGNDLTVDLSVTLEAAANEASSTALPSVRHALVESHYFRTVKMRLLRGRDFGSGDDRANRGVVIVNETAARLLWGSRDPLGRRLRLVDTKAPFEVIGVVADATYGSLKEKPTPVLYLVHSQYDKSFIGSLLAPEMTLLVRTPGAPRQMLGPVREAVRALDPRLPVFKISTLEELLASTVGVERQAATLYGSLAIVAMLLAMLGLYGALTHSIVERTREIGIRVACGASLGRVRGLVLRRSLLLSACGIAAGLTAAVPASWIVASQLYGVEVGDPATWLIATLLLMSVTLLVSVAPAHRAVKIDPVVALRSD